MHIKARRQIVTIDWSPPSTSQWCDTIPIRQAHWSAAVLGNEAAYHPMGWRAASSRMSFARNRAV